MTDYYELLDGRRVEGLHRDDVVAALAVFRAYEPKRGRIECDEESLDAMAHALAAAQASREKRQAAWTRLGAFCPATAVALLEVRERVQARQRSRDAALSADVPVAGCMGLS